MNGPPSADSPVVYKCRGCEQIGMLHRPAASGSIGVVIVPAGYQYRIGPHRQHVLLARAFGAAGIPSFRFDPPAIGDSDGQFLDFEMDQEIGAAIEAFFDHCPELENVVLWGICGSASVVAMHVPRDDPRVKGLILVNPWVRSEETLAKAYLKHYYLRKLTNPVFLRKLFTGGLQFRESARSFASSVRSALRGPASDQPGGPAAATTASPDASVESAQGSISDRMTAGLDGLDANILIVLSEADLTAQEFIEATGASVRWKRLLGASSVRRLTIPGADHIFSDPEMWTSFAAGMIEWLYGLDVPAEKKRAG